jgi:hypothetical protein
VFIAELVLTMSLPVTSWHDPALLNVETGFEPAAWLMEESEQDHASRFATPLAHGSHGVIAKTVALILATGCVLALCSERLLVHGTSVSKNDFDALEQLDASSHSLKKVLRSSKCTVSPQQALLSSLSVDSGTSDAAKGSARAEVVFASLKSHNAQLPEAALAAKYRGMNKSVWKFFRGSASLYYSDMSACDLIAQSQFNTPSTVTWIMGDCHLENFGTYRAYINGARVVAYSINDFDESWIASYLLDVYRWAASLELYPVSIKCLRLPGCDPQAIRPSITGAFVDGYLDALARINRTHQGFVLDSEHSKQEVQSVLVKTEKASARSDLLHKWTVLNESQRHFQRSEKKGKVAAVTAEQYRGHGASNSSRMQLIGCFLG